MSTRLLSLSPLQMELFPTMSTFPLEILTKILRNLTCLELTIAICVCRLWHQVIQCDPHLLTICFKQPSSTFFDEGSESKPGPVGPVDDKDGSIRFHPAMGRIRYQIGDTLSSVRIVSYDSKKCHTSLVDLPLQYNFATIPATNHMNINILPEETGSPRKARGLFGLKVSVSNPTGIRLRDIFSSVATESTESCDLVAYASGGRVSNRLLPPSLTFHKKAEILGKYKSYAGVGTAVVRGTIVEVQLCTAV